VKFDTVPENTSVLDSRCLWHCGCYKLYSVWWSSSWFLILPIRAEFQTGSSITCRITNRYNRRNTRFDAVVMVMTACVIFSSCCNVVLLSCLLDLVFSNYCVQTASEWSHLPGFYLSFFTTLNVWSFSRRGQSFTGFTTVHDAVFHQSEVICWWRVA